MRGVEGVDARALRLEEFLRDVLLKVEDEERREGGEQQHEDQQAIPVHSHASQDAPPRAAVPFRATITQAASAPPHDEPWPAVHA